MSLLYAERRRLLEEPLDLMPPRRKEGLVWRQQRPCIP